MAENISQKIIDKAFCNAYYVPNFKNILIKKIFKVLLIKIISIYRVIISFIKKLFLKLFLTFMKSNNSKSSVITIKNIDFENKSEELKRNGWCYIENFLDDIDEFITNPNIKNMYCSKCKSSNKISVMNVIKYTDVPKYNCHKCNEKQLEVFPAGDWD